MPRRWHARRGRSRRTPNICFLRCFTTVRAWRRRCWKGGGTSTSTLCSPNLCRLYAAKRSNSSSRGRRWTSATSSTAFSEVCSAAAKTAARPPLPRGLRGSLTAPTERKACPKRRRKDARRADCRRSLRSSAPTLRRKRATASSTRSSAAARKSNALYRYSAAGQRTIPC